MVSQTVKYPIFLTTSLNMHLLLIRVGVCGGEGGQGIVFLGFPI